MRILLADSDAQFVELLQSYLFDRGHEAEIASDGLACGTLLREFHPDVLVLDSQLPLAGGDEVLAQMQSDPCLWCIPVILVADSLAEDVGAADSRATFRLQKPYRLADLLAALAATDGSRFQTTPQFVGAK